MQIKIINKESRSQEFNEKQKYWFNLKEESLFVYVFYDSDPYQQKANQVTGMDDGLLHSLSN